MASNESSAAQDRYEVTVTRSRIGATADVVWYADGRSALQGPVFWRLTVRWVKRRANRHVARSDKTPITGSSGPSSAAYTPGQCAHPERCGSDGDECGHADCWWSPAEQLQREDELLRRAMRVAQMQREQERAVLRRRIFDDYAR